MPPAADAPAPQNDPVVAAPAAEVVVAAPAAEAVAVAPAAEAPAAGADHVAPVVEKPAEGEKPASDVKPAAEGDKPADGNVKPASDEPTLLEGLDKDGKPLDPKAAEVKPGEVKDPKAEEKPAEAKPGEKPAEAAPVEPLKYVAFTLPEGVTLAEAPLNEATALLGQHQVPQETAQKLIDLHVANMRNYATHLANEQQRVFGETRKTWRAQIMADEVLGGAGHQTAMAGVARMRDKFVPDTELKAFNDFLRVTGAGDHPQFHKLMHRIDAHLATPTPSPLPRNPSPDAGKQAGGRRKALYDHPRSRPGAGTS